MQLSSLTNNKYITLFAAFGSITLAIIAIIEWRKKSKQYDLNNQKTALEIEKNQLEISQLKSRF